jgi:hypothetical protein
MRRFSNRTSRDTIDGKTSTPCWPLTFVDAAGEDVDMSFTTNCAAMMLHLRLRCRKKSVARGRRAHNLLGSNPMSSMRSASSRTVKPARGGSAGTRQIVEAAGGVAMTTSTPG